MKLNELKPVPQVTFVVEVIQNAERNMYILRLSNGTFVKCCLFADEVATFFGELEFPTAPTSEL